MRSLYYENFLDEYGGVEGVAWAFRGDEKKNRFHRCGYIAFDTDRHGEKKFVPRGAVKGERIIEAVGLPAIKSRSVHELEPRPSPRQWYSRRFSGGMFRVGEAEEEAVRILLRDIAEFERKRNRDDESLAAEPEIVPEIFSCLPREARAEGRMEPAFLFRKADKSKEHIVYSDEKGGYFCWNFSHSYEENKNLPRGGEFIQFESMSRVDISLLAKTGALEEIEGGPSRKRKARRSFRSRLPKSIFVLERLEESCEKLEWAFRELDARSSVLYYEDEGDHDERCEEEWGRIAKWIARYSTAILRFCALNGSKSASGILSNCEERWRNYLSTDTRTLREEGAMDFSDCQVGSSVDEELRNIVDSINGLPRVPPLPCTYGDMEAARSNLFRG